MPFVEPRSGAWTVADIGGTHARLARWSADSGLGPALRVRNDDFADPIALLEHWFAHGGREASRQVLLALAMPVGGETTVLTNRAWQFEPPALLAALRLERLAIVNDFAAAAAGIDGLPAGAVAALDPSRSAASGATRLVLGPGTGLGTAAILHDAPPRVLASEAGHMNFGSAEPLAEQLLADGRRRWGRVSWERVLCGEGLAWIHSLLDSADEAIAPAQVAERAGRREANAVAAVRVFSRLLGEFSGDVCLAFQAGAVYLTGGVLHGIGTAFAADEFLTSFAAKGRFAPLLGRIPCYRVGGHELGLVGAARFLSGQCQMPASQWSG